MGGVAGHMSHLYDNPYLTFKEMKDKLAGYQNSKLDPKLQKKYKQVKKSNKQLQKEILELKLKLNDDEATSSSSSESDSE